MTWLCSQGSASVYQRRSDTEETVCVGKLGPSEYFGTFFALCINFWDVETRLLCTDYLTEYQLQNEIFNSNCELWHETCMPCHLVAKKRTAFFVMNKSFNMQCDFDKIQYCDCQ